jgi:hypothetical protein
MLRRKPIGLLVFLVLAVTLAAAASSCGKSSSGASVAGNCSINSDCDSPLVCAFARCHTECAESRDCPSGERCVSSTAGGVCQLLQESTCNAGTLCQSGQVCGNDQQCRVECSATVSCIMGDYCLTTGASGACYSATNSDDEPPLIKDGILAADGAVISDASVVMIAPDGSVGPSPDGSSGGPDSGALDGGNESSVTVNSCPSAQTQFGNTAQGDSNPNFTSGVGVRTSDALVIFSGYTGTAGDAGPDNVVYVQSFDPTTAASNGHAQRLFSADGDGPNILVETASVAPTGQIVVIYSFYATTGATGGVCDYGFYNYGVGTYGIGNCQSELYAAFLSPSADAGSGLQVQRIVQLASSLTYGQAHAIWSPTRQAFVISWEYYTAPAWFLGVKNFLPNGQAAGGDTAVVPTNNPSSSPDQDAVEQGGVASFSGLLGVAFQDSNGYPWVSTLDSTGNELGSPVQIALVAGSWVTIGATAQGMVYVYDNVTNVSEVFVPTSVDAGATAGIVDGGDASTYSTFSFPGAIHAIEGRALSDYAGVGGVGVATLYANGLSFAYVNADGMTHIAPSSVIAHTYAGGDQINISTFGGSFGVSLYSTATQSTQMAASGCHQ